MQNGLAVLQRVCGAWRHCAYSCGQWCAFVACTSVQFARPQACSSLATRPDKKHIHSYNATAGPAATVGVVTETNAEKAIEELKAYEVGVT